VSSKSWKEIAAEEAKKRQKGGGAEMGGQMGGGEMGGKMG
jgi:hypothetical protein